MKGLGFSGPSLYKLTFISVMKVEGDANENR